MRLAEGHLSGLSGAEAWASRFGTLSAFRLDKQPAGTRWKCSDNIDSFVVGCTSLDDFVVRRFQVNANSVNHFIFVKHVLGYSTRQINWKARNAPKPFCCMGQFQRHPTSADKNPFRCALLNRRLKITPLPLSFERRHSRPHIPFSSQSIPVSSLPCGMHEHKGEDLAAGRCASCVI
jgi:hypothetical protein